MTCLPGREQRDEQNRAWSSQEKQNMSVATKSSDAWTSVEPQVFGGPRDRSYPAHLELLHVSIYHSGPGIDEMIRFYQVALNLRHVFRIDYGTWEFIALSNDDENHRVGFVNGYLEDPKEFLGDRRQFEAEEGRDPRDLPQRPCRLEHTSWRYRDFESILLTAKRIYEETGTWPRTTRLSPVDLTIDYTDPDGHRLEMLAQFPSTRSEYLFGLYQAQQRMAARAESGKPQGDESDTFYKPTYDSFYMPLNMEKLLGLYESGVPAAELQNRENAEKLKAEGKL
jgi:hypothetical protein